MPRLTDSQRATLASAWDLVQHAGFGGFTATALNEAAANIAAEAGIRLSFQYYADLGTLYGYARRMSNAADAAQSALDSDIIGPDHMAAPPWARDEQVMNDTPKWHVVFDFTYADSAGELYTEKRTSIFDMTFPRTIGDLKDAITEDAQAMAQKYQVVFEAADLLMILAV